MTYSYTLYWLTINLPFPCEFLPPVETDSAPDVTVAYGTVPCDTQGAPAYNDSSQFVFFRRAAQGRYLINGGGRSGRFLVEDGCRITIELNSAAEHELLLFHLFRSVTAVLFRQRGFLPLHACAADMAGSAIVLCGKSAAGKSTTLAAMLRNGSKIISDDLTMLRRNGAGTRGGCARPVIHAPV